MGIQQWGELDSNNGPSSLSYQSYNNNNLIAIKRLKCFILTTIFKLIMLCRSHIKLVITNYVFSAQGLAVPLDD